ncbi:uncharacterized protein QC761_116575 [Podospora bellae-mahoneyi]|uniref:RBR-type E3 ubiquitin transferase n=1 Tax=Podospora bellae-mahoneyi TaxID=2093777 RepID=A0ABR0G0D6_9PEZI|nr:hypothetical protein QC761_116575 [Podospora bellae-mahoneyi]
MAPQTYDCQICLSPFTSPLSPLPPFALSGCNHFHCPRCLSENLAQSLKSLPFKPATCCTQATFIPPSVFRRREFGIPRDRVRLYRQKITEYQASYPTSPASRRRRQQPPQEMVQGLSGVRIVFYGAPMPLKVNLPTYCQDAKCGAFIPEVLGGRCRRCKKRTCEICKMGMHLGQGGCRKEDLFRIEERTEVRRLAAMELVTLDVKKVKEASRSEREKMEREKRAKRESEKELWALTRALMREKEWKRCPRCKNGVEKTEGCNHMICVCGIDWCYRCERAWGASHIIGMGACAG